MIPDGIKKEISDVTEEGRQHEDGYDPYVHRKPKKPLSNFISLIILLKSTIGTGLFAMPKAFACVGLSFGIIGTILIGLLITMALRFFVKIHHTMCVHSKKPTIKYDDVVVTSLTTQITPPNTTNMRNAWFPSKLVTSFVNVTIISCYLAIGSIYMDFVIDVVEACVNREGIVSRVYYALVLLPPFLVVNMIKNFHDFGFASVSGNVLILGTIVIGIIYAFSADINGDWTMIQSDVSLYPTFIGIVIFGMSSPGFILTIEHNMKQPWNYKHFCGILNQAMAIIIPLYIFVGTIGYMKWGTNVSTNFLRSHPKNDWLTIIAFAMQASGIYLTYGLQCYAAIAIITEEYVIPIVEGGVCKGTAFLWDLITRFTVTFVTCVLAIIFPWLYSTVDLVGLTCLSTLTIQIPIVLHTLVHVKDFGKFKWKLILGITTIVGLMNLAFYSIIAKFHGRKENLGEDSIIARLTLEHNTQIRF